MRFENSRPDIVLIGLQPDSQRYFDVHHAGNDVFEMSISASWSWVEQEWLL
jgi:hypothetical protein